VRQRGEAGFRGRVVALIHVAKEPRFAAGVDGARRNAVIRIPALLLCGRPARPKRGGERALLRDSEVIE